MREFTSLPNCNKKTEMLGNSKESKEYIASDIASDNANFSSVKLIKAEQNENNTGDFIYPRFGRLVG